MRILSSKGNVTIKPQIALNQKHCQAASVWLGWTEDNLHGLQPCPAECETVIRYTQGRWDLR